MAKFCQDNCKDFKTTGNHKFNQVQPFKFSKASLTH